MKAIFMIYHDVLDDRITEIQRKLGIDFFTKWEDVKGKGHNTDPHLGTRTFPGHNCVRMLAFQEDISDLNSLVEEVKKLNNEVLRPDDKVRIFQMPLEMVL